MAEKYSSGLRSEIELFAEIMFTKTLETTTTPTSLHNTFHNLKVSYENDGI